MVEMTTATPPSRLVISSAVQRSIRFVVAMGLLVYEAVLRVGEPRWPLLVVYGGMMGLPLAERADDLRRLAKGPEVEP